MPVASSSDENRVVQILSRSFTTNPSVIAAVKPNRIENRIEELSRYAFRTGIRRDGVFLSNDQTAAAICYNPNSRKEGFVDYVNQLRLVRKAIGFDQVPRMLKKEGYIKKKRPQNQDYLYFWFLGAEQKGNGAVKELVTEVFQLSKDEQLPIYLETSVVKNKNVYERFGFEVFHEWQQPDNTVLYFMWLNP